MDCHPYSYVLGVHEHNLNYSPLDLGASDSETVVRVLSIHLAVTFQLEMKLF
jgi:hypothetical protein